MTRLLKTLLMTMILSLSSLQGHGGGHSHSHDAPAKEEVSKSAIKKMAKQELKRLTVQKKIDGSWLFVPISKMSKTNYNYNNEWIVEFKNVGIKEKSKQTLYVFISVYGDLMGANYTGK